MEVSSGCLRISISCQASYRCHIDIRTFAIHDFLRVASESHSAILSRNGKLLSIRTEIFEEGSKNIGTDAPSIICSIMVE